MTIRVEALSSFYGRVRALHQVTLAIGEGKIVALVGANGAGKTTLLRVLSGVQPASAGRVTWDGSDVTRLSAAKRVRLGLSQVPEGRLIFGPLSVQDNLELGGYCRKASDLTSGMQQVFELFPVLDERRHSAAGALSGGEQQMLAIGRALMSQPRVLLLDEPSLGLAPMVVAFIFQRIRELNRRGMTIVLVEQNARLALEIADHAYVVETGEVVAEGSGKILLQDPTVQSAYLGL
jgi:branched-chain amino acid transport system ATP-binding protein